MATKGRGVLFWVFFVLFWSALVVAGVVVFLSWVGVEDVREQSAPVVSVEERRAQERAQFEAVWTAVDERSRKRDAEDAARKEQLEKAVVAAAEVAKQKPRQVRRVRRWPWMSPAQKRAKVWNVPQRETDEATVTGLLRICTSEQEGSVTDCLGIWQVLQNIRSRECNRSYTQLITECDENGETMLSAMGRASR
jgi:hypothetical protein